ncbi:unnamed protein product, partial [Oppiella nova]
MFGTTSGIQFKRHSLHNWRSFHTLSHHSLTSHTIPVIMSLIRLQTTDGDIHEWAKEKAMMSNTLKDMIEAIPEETDKAIPLQQISSATLKKVEEWVEYHCNDQKDSDSDSDDDETCAKCVDEMTAWDTKYFDMEREAFFALLEAANYLHIEGM